MHHWEKQLPSAWLLWCQWCLSSLFVPQTCRGQFHKTVVHCVIQSSHFQSKEPALEVILQQVWLGALLTTLSQILMSVALSGVPWLWTPGGRLSQVGWFSVLLWEKHWIRWFGAEDCQHRCFCFKLLMWFSVLLYILFVDSYGCIFDHICVCCIILASFVTIWIPWGVRCDFQSCKPWAPYLREERQRAGVHEEPLWFDQKAAGFVKDTLLATIDIYSIWCLYIDNVS